MSGGEERSTEVIAGASCDYSIKASQPGVWPPIVSYYPVPAFVFVSAGVSSLGAGGGPRRVLMVPQGLWGLLWICMQEAPAPVGSKVLGLLTLSPVFPLTTGGLFMLVHHPSQMLSPSVFILMWLSFLYAGFVLHSLFITPYISPLPNSLFFANFFALWFLMPGILFTPLQVPGA